MNATRAAYEAHHEATSPGTARELRGERASEERTAHGLGTGIVVEGLRKVYGDTVAVDDLSFSVEPGEVFALLGPNGAGKTTTVEILEGYRSRDGGQVSVLGIDPAHGGRHYRERIGVVLQSAGFEDEFSVRELVRLQATFYPRRFDPDQVIELVGLVDKATARVKSLSGGQRRRLDLALGLVGAPEVLFLDEPTTGFDPSARRRAWDLIHGLRELGTTILLTTHYMDEAQRLADRVAVIRDGRLVGIGAPDEIGGDSIRAGGAGDGSRNDAQFAAQAARIATLIEFRLPTGCAEAELPALVGTMAVGLGMVRVETAHPVKDVNTLTEWALARGVELPGLVLSRPSLEDVYLSLTEEATRVG